MSEARQHVAPRIRRGLFTVEQYMVLKYRARGFSQRETAEALGTSRSNVSMIESRAKKKLSAARATVRAYQSMLPTNYVILVGKGTRLQDIPLRILGEGDRRGIHLRSNVTEIIRLVKSVAPRHIRAGRTTRELRFIFDTAGRLRLVLGRGQMRPKTRS